MPASRLSRTRKSSSAQRAWVSARYCTGVETPSAMPIGIFTLLSKLSCPRPAGARAGMAPAMFSAGTPLLRIQRVIWKADSTIQGSAETVVTKPKSSTSRTSMPSLVRIVCGSEVPDVRLTGECSATLARAALTAPASIAASREGTRSSSGVTNRGVERSSSVPAARSPEVKSSGNCRRSPAVSQRTWPATTGRLSRFASTVC